MIILHFPEQYQLNGPSTHQVAANLTQFGKKSQFSPKYMQIEIRIIYKEIVFYLQLRSSFQVVMVTESLGETYLITSYEDLNYGAELVMSFLQQYYLLTDDAPELLISCIENFLFLKKKSSLFRSLLLLYHQQLLIYLSNSVFKFFV